MYCWSTSIGDIIISRRVVGDDLQEARRLALVWLNRWSRDLDDGYTAAEILDTLMTIFIEEPDRLESYIHYAGGCRRLGESNVPER